MNKIEEPEKRNYEPLTDGMAANVITRPSFRQALRHKVRELHMEIEQLEALERALPLELPPPADEILWRLLVRP